MRSILIASIIATAITNNAFAIEPSQAFGTATDKAIEVADFQLQNTQPVSKKSFRVYETSTMIGKYKLNQFGDYNINVNFVRDGLYYSCQVSLTIFKDVLRKRLGETFEEYILETFFIGAQEMQTVIRIYSAGCSGK